MIKLNEFEKTLCTPKVICGYAFLLPTAFGQGFAVEYNNCSERRYMDHLAEKNAELPKDMQIPFTAEGFEAWGETPEGAEGTNRAMLDAYLVPDGHAIRAGDFYRFIPIAEFQEVVNFLLAGTNTNIPLPTESGTTSAASPTPKKSSKVIKAK